MTPNNSPGHATDPQSFVIACIRCHCEPQVFRSLLLQYDERYPVSLKTYCSTFSSLQVSSIDPDLLFEYIYTISVSTDLPKFALPNWWNIFAEENEVVGVSFQIKFMNNLVNAMRYIDFIVERLFCFSENCNNEGSLSCQNKFIIEFFSSFSNFMRNADRSNLELIKEIQYFLGALIEGLNRFLLKPENKYFLKKNTDDGSVIPKEFIEKLYEFHTQILIKFPQIDYVCLYVEDLIKQYYHNLGDISKLTHSGSSQATLKVFKLIWMNNIIRNNDNNNDFFVINCVNCLKNELKILNVRSNGNDLKLLVHNLIQSSLEMFCISIVNKIDCGVLKRWKIFIEKQLPLLLLRLKENKLILKSNNNEFEKINSQTLDINDNGSNLESIDANDSDTEGDAKMNLDLNNSEDNWNKEVKQLIKLSESIQTPSKSIAIQNAIIECITYLDDKMVKIFKTYAKVDDQSKSDWIVDIHGVYPTVNYFKVAEPNEEDEMFASFPSTLIDIRHDFLKSCVALNLINESDFNLCLKQDAKSEVRNLNTNDIAKDINTGTLIYNINKYIFDIFLSKNPEFDSAESSLITKFLYQVSEFEATCQYQIAIIILQTIKKLVAEKKGPYIRRLVLALLLNLETLDVFTNYIKPIEFIKPLIKALDEYNTEGYGEDFNFQDTFTDFGCSLLFVIIFIKRYQIKLNDVINVNKSDHSFCVSMLVNFGNLRAIGQANLNSLESNKLGIDKELVNNWTNELFYSSSGLSDELIIQSTVKQSFQLASIIFQQAFLALRQELIDFDLFKNGVEYFFQPFLLSPLLGIFNWVEDLIWNLTPINTEKSRKDFELVLKVIDYLVNPVVNEEARVMHGLILQYVAPSLLPKIINTVDSFNAESRNKIIINSKTLTTLQSRIKKNSYPFNLILTSSNKIFTESHLIIHFNIKFFENGNLNKRKSYQNPHQYSYFDKNSYLQTIEEQVHSLILWCYNSPQLSFGFPSYDPFLLDLLICVIGAEKVLEFFVSLVVSYESIVKDLYLNSSTLKNGTNNGVRNISNKIDLHEAKVELYKKQLGGKKTGNYLTKDAGVEIMRIVIDILAMHITHSGNINSEKKINYWQKHFKKETGENLHDDSSNDLLLKTLAQLQNKYSNEKDERKKALNKLCSGVINQLNNFSGPTVV